MFISTLTRRKVHCHMNLKNKSVVFSYIEKGALILILYKMITLIIGGGEQFYSTHIDRFVWEGIIYLGIAILIVFKVNLKNFLIYIPTAIYLIVFYILLLRTGYKVNSPDLWMMDLRKGLAVATLIPLVVDAICKKRFCRFKELDLAKIILFALIYIGVAVVPGGINGYLLFCFVITYMIISFDKDRIEIFIVCLAVANVLAATVLSVKSLITHPYAGELRYYGAFTNLHGFGMFVGSGIACCLFLYIWGHLHFEKKWIHISMLTPITLFLLVVFYLINSRNALLGVIVAIIVTGWLFSVAIKKSKLFAGTICGVVIVALIVGGICLFFGLNYEKYEKSLRKIPQLHYMVQYAKLNEPIKSETGVFEDNTLLCRIDEFTNSRLSVWKVTVEQLKLFEGNSTNIVVNDEWTTNTHNTYLGYLNGWGIIVGGLFIVALIYVLVQSVRQIKANRDSLKTNGTFAIFAVLWFAYSFTIFMNEMLYPTALYVIICLLLLGLLPRINPKTDK